jgi:Ca-activated chloride channel family protein
MIAPTWFALLPLVLPAVEALPQDAPPSAPAAAHCLVPQIGALNLGAPNLGEASAGAPREPVRLEHVRAEATVGVERATTQLVLALHNPNPEAEPCSLLVPLPAELAAPSVVELRVGETVTLLEHRSSPAPENLSTLLALARAAQSPRVLEFAGRPCLFAESFALPPGPSELHLRYEHLLPDHSADPRHPAPMYELPRCEGALAYAVPWVVELTVQDDGGLADVFCPTHHLVQRSSTRQQRLLTALAGRHPEPGPLRLFPIPERGDLATLLLTWPAAQDGGRFLLVAAPSESARRAAREQPRELTFVLDTSGSMAGVKLEQAREAARQVLESLRPAEHFNLITYAKDVHSLFDGPQPATPENLAEARAFLAAAVASGSTNIDGALARALAQPRREGTLPLVLFLTDGLPTVEPKQERTIVAQAEQRNTGQRRVFCFGVGEDVNAPLLDTLARASRATSHYVAPNQDIEEEVGRVHAGLSGPLFAAPNLAALDEHGRKLAEVVLEPLPARLPDLFAEDRLVVLGRYASAAPLDLSLEGRWLGAEQRFTVRLDPAAADPAHAFVPGLWATRRIAALVDAIRTGGADGAAPARLREQASELLRLSLRFGVITEYTSFLALPNAQELDAEQSLAMLQKLLTDRAVRARVGRAAITQSQNLDQLLDRTVLDRSNRYLDAERREVLVAGVVGLGDRAFFSRSGAWVDSRLLEAGARTAIDERVDFGSERHGQLVAALSARGEAAALALPGAVVLPHEGRNYLVRQP